MLVTMGGVRRTPLGFLIAAIVATASACASIWGFQDGVDLPDAADATEVDATGVDATGVDATGTDGGSEGMAVHPDAGDASVEAAIDAPDEATVACMASCVPAVPAGWQGPLEIYEGLGATPDCDAGAYPNVSYDGKGPPDASAAACSCSCSAPSGGACAAPLASYFDDFNCTQSCGTQNQPIESTCTALALGGCGVGTHVAIAGSVASSGSCAPDAGAQVAAPTWAGLVRLCGSSGTPAPGGCNAGEVCAAASDPAFEPTTYCITQTGTWTCPVGYAAPRTYYDGFVDTRGCTPCTCGSPHATCTGGTFEGNNGSACTGTLIPLPVPTVCSNLGGAKSALISGLILDGGSCAPEGGAPTGTFTPTTSTTICCTR
jgi:hypothetical protein